MNHDVHGHSPSPATSHDHGVEHQALDEHAGHSVAKFRDKFWTSLALTIPAARRNVTIAPISRRFTLRLNHTPNSSIPMRTAYTLLPLLCAASMAAHAQAPAHPEIDAFNRAFASATRHMDNAATLALWEDDGVSLLPSTAPISGKPAITKFMNDVMSSLAGARMTSFDLACYDIQTSGSWASEWCTEHQIVALPKGKPPFDGRGKMLLVLHRAADGHWRIHDEMWNQALAPAANAQ